MLRGFTAVVLLWIAANAAAEVASEGGCAGALVIPGPYNGQAVIANTTFAPTYEQNVCNLSTNAGTYFYVITPTADAPMTLSTCHADTTFDTVLAVFEGDDCDSLHCVASNDDTSCSEVTNASSIVFMPTGGSYWVMVSGYSSAVGEFQLTFEQTAPTEAACNTAVAIHGPFDPPISIFGSLSGNTSPEQPCDAYSNMLGNWYIIYPTPDNLVTVTTCGDYFDFDTEIAVLVGPDCSELQCVAYNDDNCDTSATLSTVVFRASESDFYYVYVTGYGTSTGSYYLTISETEPGPYEAGCYSAIDLPGPGIYRDQTNEDEPPMRSVCCLDHDVEYFGIWYTISTPPHTRMTITTCTQGQNNNFDSEILVFPSCGAECIAINDDASCSYNSFASTVTVVSGNAPTDYYIAVVGFSGTEGDFDLTVTWK